MQPIPKTQHNQLHLSHDEEDNGSPVTNITPMSKIVMVWKKRGNDHLGPSICNSLSFWSFTEEKTIK
jgi:hypothetical protein